MAQVIVGFSRPKSWFNPFSWLIRIGEGSIFKWAPMSHAYIRYYDEYTQNWLIFQASGEFVNLENPSIFNSKENVVAEFAIDISDATLFNTIQYAQNVLGAPYGIKHVFGLGLVLIARLFGKKMANPFNESGTMVCSELVSCVMQEVWNQQDGFDPGTVLPIDIFNYLNENGFKRLV